MNAFRSFLYALASLLGDINAVRRGPNAMAKRAVRKAGWRTFGKLFRL